MSDTNTQFEAIGRQDKAHLENIGRPGRFAPLPPTTRAQALTSAMIPLHAVSPVLEANYLVKGWLGRGTLSVVYGESNVGKTFLALDLAVHVAGGAEDWHGARLAEAVGPVIYLAAEGGHGIRNRLSAIKVEEPDLFREAEDRFFLLPTALDLRAGLDAPALIDAIKATSPNDMPSLIIVDTLARTMGTGDENTAKDMGAYIANLDRLRAATDAHVMVIHHSGKDPTSGARGSSSLRAAVDTEIELTRSGMVIMAEARKQRDMRVGEVFAYTLRDVVIGRDEAGDDVTTAVIEQTEPVTKRPKLSPQQKIAMQALYDALAHHGEKKGGDMFPDNRRCVSKERWSEYCKRHSLSDGSSDSAARQAFGRVWKALQKKEMVRVVDGFVWACFDE